MSSNIAFGVGRARHLSGTYHGKGSIPPETGRLGFNPQLGHTKDSENGTSASKAGLGYVPVTNYYHVQGYIKLPHSTETGHRLLLYEPQGWARHLQPSTLEALEHSNNPTHMGWDFSQRTWSCTPTTYPQCQLHHNAV